MTAACKTLDKFAIIDGFPAKCALGQVLLGQPFLNVPKQIGVTHTDILWETYHLVNGKLPTGIFHPIWDESHMAVDKHKLMLERIQEGLEKIGKRPKPAAVFLGLSETAILDILKGRSKNPKRNTLQILADGFGMSVEYLTGNADSPNSTGVLPELIEEFSGIEPDVQRTFIDMIRAMKDKK